MTVRKFFAIAFMCHQIPERSFFIKGKQLPLCARCTGIFVGYILGIILACVVGYRKLLLISLLIIPMLIDGGIQLIFKKESNNIRRFVTGILGGIGIIYLLLAIHTFTVWWVSAVMIKLKII